MHLPLHDTDLLIKSLTAETLLGFKTPEQFFDPASKPTIDQFHLRMRKLRSHWHREGNPDALTAILHMEEIGEAKIKQGLWSTSRDLFVFKTDMADGTEIEIQYSKKDTVPGWGTRLETKGSTAYIIPSENADLLKNWQEEWSKKMDPKSLLIINTEQFESQLSILPKTWGGEGGKNILLRVPRSKFINAKDVKDHLGGKAPVEHVAWMLSRLYNLACFMQVHDVVSLDLTPASCYINPETHQLVVINGWQYARGLSQPAFAAPGHILSLFPDLKTKKIPTMEMILTQIKTFGLAMLGDPVGNNLVKDKSLPSPLINWLLSPACGDAIKEYGGYIKARDASFERKFVKWDLEFTDVYKDNNP